MPKPIVPIQVADPIARRRALIALIVLAVAGVFAYMGLEEWLSQLEASDPDHARAALASALLWASGAMAVTIAALGVYFLLLGRRVRRAERFPLPGAKVARDTPVVTGSAARARGFLLQLIAGVLMGCAVVLLAMAWRLASYAG